MKFNARDLQILKNFATINQSIVFRPGNVIRTVSQSKSVFVKANISDEIDETYAIYELPQYLGAISLIDDADITVKSNIVHIAAGKELTQIAVSDPSLILAAPEKDIKLPSIDVEFTLEEATLNKAIKQLGMLKLPEIAIVGDGEHVYISACSSKNRDGANYRMEVGDTDKTFRLYFLADNLNLLSSNYNVKVCSKGLAQFQSDDITYWIAVEQNSEFPE